MSRPKPTVLLENVDKASYKCEQVLKADAIWAVFYQGAPFNLKTSNAITTSSSSQTKFKLPSRNKLRTSE